MKGRMLAMGLLVTWGASACKGSPETRPGPMPATVSQEPWQAPMRLSPPERLPPQARQLVRQRMWQHGSDMSALVWAVFSVDYERAGELAGRIASDAALTRPLSQQASELGGQIPARFFELQDELHRKAGALAVSSLTKNAGALSQAYGSLSETCINCHDVYRGDSTQGR